MNKNKKIFLILACLALLVFIGSTAYTYAKYFTVKQGIMGSEIRIWNIKINDENIKTGQRLSETITATIDENKHTASGKIAPGSKGHFTIVVDYSNVDLSFNYELLMGENENLPDLKIYKLEVDDVEITQTDGANMSNDVIITDPDDDRKKIIEVFIEWNDDENNGATMSNEEDTQIPINYDSIEFDVEIILTQIQ